mmetsp:Transcript_5152/g.5108  ORF Transcript_5152/g.5108 Transcript_5152/m.5108 type:complete len:201 (-) Transcript_5152:55-657(-)
MWRPFQNYFVNHSFDSYSKQHDRVNVLSLNPVVKKEKPKFDLNLLYPYNLKAEEKKERENRLKELQERVKSQRELIKERDLISKMKGELKTQRYTYEMIRYKEKKNEEIKRIREIIGKRKSSPKQINTSRARIDDNLSFFITERDSIKRASSKRMLPSFPLKSQRKSVVSFKTKDVSKSRDESIKRNLSLPKSIDGNRSG